MIGISLREFARRDGCSETLVRRAIVQGRLKAAADGSIDPALVKTAWRKGNEQQEQQPAHSSQTAANKAPHPVPLLEMREGESVDEAVKRIIASGGAPYTKAEAERVKENYLALTRRLDYDLRSGAVVPVAEVKHKVAAEYAKVRTRLLAIPAEQAPALHLVRSVTELQEAIRKAIATALEELTLDAAA